MKQLFQENKNAFLILLVLILILILAVYFLFFRPLTIELDQTLNEEQNIQREIDLLSVQVQKLEEEQYYPVEDIEEIQLERKIPRLRELEEFLLTLNEIELVSETKINSMNFGYQGNLPELNASEEDSTDDFEETDETTSDTDEQEGIDDTKSIPVEFLEMPEGIETVTVTLDIEAPDYDHFQLLLKEIEKQERIIIVTKVNFNKPGEEELILAEEPTEIITATIVLTTFYFN